MNYTEKQLYKELFWSTFFISLFTFGGGYVIVPMMEKKFVKELEWIDYEEMFDLIAIAQSSPGPIAVNVAVLIGYRMKGVKGALVTTVGTTLPPLVIMSVLAYIYLAVRDNPFVNNLLKGMQAGVAAIIINIVYDMGARIVKQKKVIPIIVMFLSLIAAIIFSVNILFILLFSAFIGLLTMKIERLKNSGGI